MNMKTQAFKIKIAILTLVLAVLFFGWQGMQKAEAQSTDDILKSILDAVGGGLKVNVIGNTSKPDTATALQGTLSRMFLGISSGELQSINLKETVLDPIAWNIAKQLQQQMTGDLLKWLGGELPGQEGEVPFVQNYSEFYADLLDEVAGDVIFGGDLTGMCSEEKNFQARQKAYESYTKSRSNQSIFSCPTENASGTQKDNMVTKIFKGTVSCDGNAVCAGYKAENHLAVRQANAVANENRVLDYSRGMKPQRVCKETEDTDGRPRQVCEIVNPPFLAADNASFQLTQVPSLQLLQMDEFNEIVSSFMTRLTSEAVTGISSLANGIDFTGVLGLSGNPDYTNLLFGPNGGLSYVDSLLEDDASQYQSFGTNPIVKALEIERKNLSLQGEIVTAVTELETKTASNIATYGSCYDLPLNPELKEILDTAKVNQQVASTSLNILNALNQQYNGATNASTKSAAISAYVSYKNQGLFSTEQKNQELEVSFIDYTFAILVDQFKFEMATKQQSCGGPFDYDGPTDDDEQERDDLGTGGSN